MAQRAAIAIGNAYKARESGLQFDIVLVFMVLAFLGGREAGTTGTGCFAVQECLAPTRGIP